MNDVFVYPLQNSKEYKDVINCITNNKGSLLVNGLLPVQNLMLPILYSGTYLGRLSLWRVVI